MNFTDQFEQIDPEVHGIKMPLFKLDKEDAERFGVSPDISSLDFFTFLVKKGFEERIAAGEIDTNRLGEYKERLEYELSVISPTDFVEYLLIVWQTTEIARKNGIAAGIARGSSGGCLILFFLRVTGIDPIKYGLYFERFLSEERLKPKIVNGEKFFLDACDIDQDYSDNRREELIDILKEKHKGHLCKISTFGTLQGKKCIKEVCKIVLGYTEQQALEISSLIPSVFGRVYSLKQAVEEVPLFAKFAEKNKKAYKIALKLSELIVSIGSHASAYALSHKPLIESVPCQMGEDEMVTTYDMQSVMLYNIKLDLLGLKAVTIIDEVCKQVNTTPGNFELDYNNVYSHIQDVKYPYGLFQISADTNRKVVNQVKPQNIDHLSAIVALARPGALEFVPQYAKFVSEGECDSVHPFFDDVLQPTAGLVLYQENLLQMGSKIGLLKTDIESLRKLVGKKEIKKIPAWKEKVTEVCKENNISKEVFDVFWRVLEASASYSFNKSLGGESKVEILGEDGSISREIKNVKKGDKVLAYDVLNQRDHYVEVLDVMSHKTQLFEFFFENGKSVICSLRHKFLTNAGMKPTKEIFELSYGVRFEDEKHYKITKYVNKGEQISYDLEVDHPDHNFYVSGFVTSNSHSYSYATLSAQTVFLKFKYPQQFFLACLKIAATRSDFLQEFASIQQELPHFGIKLLPPNIAKSDLDFAIEGNDIRFGLSEIKGISDKTLDKLREFLSSEKQTNFQVFEAAKEAKLSIGVLSALIQCGALGHNIYERSKTVLSAQVWNLLTPKEKFYCLSVEDKYGDLFEILRDYLTWADSSGKIFTKESRLQTIRKKTDKYFKIYNLNSKNELLASYFYEKMLLGFSYSSSLKMVFGENNPDLRNLEEIDQYVPVKSGFEVVANVKEVMSGTSKSGNKYLKLKISDETKDVNAMLLGNKLAKYLDKFPYPKEDDVVYISGQKGEDILWINFLEVQSAKVYTTLRDLPAE